MVISIPICFNCVCTIYVSYTGGSDRVPETPQGMYICMYYIYRDIFCKVSISI